MHRYLMASVATFAFGIGAASAADLGAPAPAPIYTKAPVAVPFSWTGFYVGGNVGYGWGTANNSLSFSQTDTPPSPNLATFGAADPNKLNGIIGGGQIGYNWQVNNIVVGIESDIQASGQNGTNTFGGTIDVIPSFVANNPTSVTDTDKLDWFGTTRGRVGLAMDRWLVYGTGGIAYGEVNQSGNIQPANGLATENTNAPIFWNQSTTKVGWAAGAGVENAITPNWSWKVEYLYMDLGTATADVTGGTGTIIGESGNCYGGIHVVCALFRNPPEGTVTSHFTDSILRLGVNYRFN
jgi:outer membrane immunogenic protein